MNAKARLLCLNVIASAAKQSIEAQERKLDCFAEPVIGRRFAPTRWLAMTDEAAPILQPSSPGSTGRSSIPEAVMAAATLG
jgi:hypothetical protein